MRNTAHIRNLSTVLASDGSAAAAGAEAEAEDLAPGALPTPVCGCCRSGSRSWAMARRRRESGSARESWGKPALACASRGARPCRLYTARYGCSVLVSDGDGRARSAEGAQGMPLSGGCVVAELSEPHHQRVLRSSEGPNRAIRYAIMQTNPIPRLTFTV